MHPEIGFFFLWLSVGLGISTIGFCVAWLRTRERWVRADARAKASDLLESGAPRLAATVDSIALEVERIGESQRFLHKLLASRQVGGLKEEVPRDIGSPG